MSNPIKTEPLDISKIDLELCSCCLNCDNLINMIERLDISGVTDIDDYSSLINSCFGAKIVDFSNSIERYYICDECSQRLVSSYLFKCQVLKTQRTIWAMARDSALSRDDTKGQFTNALDIEYLNDLDKTNADNSTFEDYDCTISQPIKRPRRKATVRSVPPLGNDIVKKRTAKSGKKIKQTQSCIKSKRKVTMQLNAEIRTAMDTDKKQCRVCMKVFLNNVTLNQHMNEHFTDYTCELCGKSFATIYRLEKHQTNHRTGAYKCDKCYEVFDTCGKLQRHRAKTHFKNTYCCPHCKKRFISFYSRQKHLKDEHDDFRPYPCKHCNVVCLTSGKLGLHVRTAHMVRARSHSCPHCDKEYFDASTLREHVFTHGSKNHECGICKKAFLMKKRLVQHMKTHLNIQNYSCSHCKESFIQKVSLKGHLRIHESGTSLNFQIIS